MNEIIRTAVEIVGLGITIWQLQNASERRQEKKQDERHSANIGRFDFQDSKLVELGTKVTMLETQIGPLWKSLLNKLDKL